MNLEAISLHSILVGDARRIFEEAKFSCSGGLVDIDDCSWYHGGWPVLRALGLVSNPYWHFEFIRRHVADRTAGKFLVLGTADASTPFLLHSLGAKVIDIIDVCQTALYTCNLVSERFALNWDTACVNALKIPEEGRHGQYETVINDAFLTRFNQDEKERVVANVHAMLSPSGVYISTARIGAPNVKREIKGYQSTENRREYFVERAVSRFHEIGGLADFSEEEIISIATSYMRRMVSYRFDCEDHLRRTLHSGGLKVVFSQIVTTPGESEESDYVRFVAVRLNEG